MAKQGNSKTILRWILLVGLGAAASFAALKLYEPPPPEIPTARVERRDFVTTVSSRGDLESARSVQITAPQTPDLKIVQLAENGKPVQRGQVVVAFDAASQEDLYVTRDTTVRQVESEIKQADAQHSIVDEQNELLVMQSKYNVERANLEASKQEILAEIEAAKAKIDVDIMQGELRKAQTTSEATDISQKADLARLEERLNKAVRDRDLSKTYLGSMELRSPVDGVIQIMDNNRAQGSFGTSRPPFQEGDTVWTGAVIAEIPDLSSLRVNFRLEEIDRGRVREGLECRIRVDAVPDAQLTGKVDWLSPIATLVFRRIPPDKNFPALASIDKLDPRLRPGMSATVDVVVERDRNVMVIPVKASFQVDGKPTVFVKTGSGFRAQPIEVGSRNSNEIVVTSGLEEGDEIALENPGLRDTNAER
ncbi:MAG: HlyD family efflux transporter periplasmic adaptor subunit [Bryobacterales bacterium]|nr:HlyD family efflux transporter periplasmic adaptor subunit [Acidobacteriota bacterium]MCB9383765.1 HlyD family efflux transporter periplasmic adaptor subunit [Bryobacterales bacterium]